MLSNSWAIRTRLDLLEADEANSAA